MMEYLETILIIFVEMLCFRLFLDIFVDKRNTIVKEVIFWAIIIAVLCVVNKLPVIFIVKELLSIMVLTLGTYSYYKISITKSLICASSYVAILLLSDLITYMIYDRILYVKNSSEEFVGMLIILMSKCILLIMVLLIRHFTVGRYKDSINNADWIKFLVFPMLSVAMIGVLLKNGMLGLSQPQKDILWMLIFLLIVMNMFMYLYIQDIDKKNALEYEKYVLEMDRKTQMRWYESIENSLEKQRSLSHDYKNHVVCIHTMLEQGKYDEAKSYLDKISNVISHNLDMIDTNHIAVNAILNAKYQEALNKDIVVVCKANDLSGIILDDTDIVLILSNLFNNAIEACEKCKGKRMLKFKFVVENEEIILSMKNSYNGVILKSGETFLTTKHDCGNGTHGIGLNNIIKTVEKYNGFYNISYDEKEFHIFIDISNRNSQQNDF